MFTTHLTSTQDSVLLSPKLITFELRVEGITKPFRALVDTGASNNFVRSQTLLEHSLAPTPSGLTTPLLVVRLANGTTIQVPKQTISLCLSFNGFKGEDTFIILGLDERFDIILGMPWLTRHSPLIDWSSQSLSFPHRSDETAPTIIVEEQVFWTGVSLLEEHHSSLTSPACDGPVASVPHLLPSKPLSLSNRFSILDGLENDSPTVPFSAADVVFPLASDAMTAFPQSQSPLKTCRRSKRKLRPRNLQCSSPDQAQVTETINALVHGVNGKSIQSVQVQNPPSTVEDLCSLPVMHSSTFLKQLKCGNIEQICRIVAYDHASEDLFTSSTMDPDVDHKTKVERFESQSWETLKSNPAYSLLREFQDIFPDEVPSVLPKDRGIRHEIDLVPGTKYCVTRQWPLPREQVEAIDKFFESRRRSGHVRESKSPHCTPTFCVKKATGGWRIVHAFNKLNDATIPAQTPIPRKDMTIDSMQGSQTFSAIDLMDGYYQILMREKDIPLTAVSTPSGMLWEWLVMPQGLKNAPATFNRMVSHLLRPFRDFAPSYFDDIFVHSKEENGKPALQVHLEHLRKVFEVMRENKFYANLKKCIFCADEIPVLGCFVGAKGVRPDPEKIKSIADWPVPTCVKDLRKWLGLANYLHKYTKNYAHLVHPLTQLLRNDTPWKWGDDQQIAFDAIKKSLQEAPILALPDYSKTFHVVCDASNFAIGCALMQHDDDGRERVVSYQSRQLRPAERNYPVHDKELLSMTYALVKFRVYLMGQQKFAIYTDHASLRTAVKTPHLSQRMARWLSFFSEYNFVVHYKPGKTNILADALSRRPDYDSTDSSVNESVDDCRACTADVCAVATRATSALPDEIRAAYASDPNCNDLIRHFSDPNAFPSDKLSSKLRSRLHRYSMRDGLLYYTVDPADHPRIVVPVDNDLRTRILAEFHDSPFSGHLGREKTFLALSRDFYWSHMYKWVRKYVRTCEVCQRVKPSASSQAPLRSLPVPSQCWQSISMDFIFGLPPDSLNRTGILVFVDRFSKMVHLVPVKDSVSAKETAQLFVDTVFRSHGMPKEIVSDRDPRFTSVFWRAVFKLIGTNLAMSTAAHPETDGQTERVNRVLEDVLRSYATTFSSWSSFLSIAEFAINNSVHASHGFTPFFVNFGRHPHVPALLDGDFSTVSVGGTLESNQESEDQQADRNKPVANVASSTLRRSERLAKTKRVDLLTLSSENPIQAHFNELPELSSSSNREKKSINDFILQRQMLLRFVKDSLAESVDRQKEQADKRGRKNKETFNVNDRVLLATANLPTHALSNMQSRKLTDRFIGPFRVTRRNGDAYTLDLPKAMRLHPTFYVGRLKRYHPSVDDDVRSSNQHSSSDQQFVDPSVSNATQSSPIERDALEGSLRTPSASHTSLEAAGPACRGSAPGQRAYGRLPSFQQVASSTARAFQTQSEAQRTAASATKQKNPSTTGSSSPRFSRSRPGARPLIDSNGVERWIVDTIVDHIDLSPDALRRMTDKNGHIDAERIQNAPPCARNSRNIRVFRVRWIGYDSDHDTWIRESLLLEDVPDVVEEYNSRQD